MDRRFRPDIEAAKAKYTIASTERGLVPEALLIICKIYAIEKLARETKISIAARIGCMAKDAVPVGEQVRARSRHKSWRHDR